MVAAREHLPKLTPEEYFAWEEQQEVKHEYFEGEVYAMSGGTQNHSRVGGRLFSLIDLHLDNRECVVLTSDARVKIQESEKYVYPDVSVTCDERDRETPQFITHPCTEAYDRGDKFELYRRSTSLREYALVSADKIAIDLHRKDDLNRWQSIYFRAGDTVELESINLTFPIERVYRGIEF
jgi:Uma2 family endonuclease